MRTKCILPNKDVQCASLNSVMSRKSTFFHQKEILWTFLMLLKNLTHICHRFTDFTEFRNFIMIFITLFIEFLLTITSVRCKEPRKTILATKLGEVYLNHSIADSATTFTDLVRDSSMFIDKTLLIKEFIECSNSMLLIICPRGWCKSVNLEMLKAFFQIEVDSTGKILSPPTRAPGYRLFQKGEVDHKDGSVGRFRSPFLITKHKDLLDYYQGKYPVIYLNLKNAIGENYDSLMRRVRTAISHTFNEHCYMIEVFKTVLKDNAIKAKGTAAEDLKKFTAYLEKVEDIPNIEYSLYYLSSLLSEHFHKDVYVFVDEYDAPIRSIFKYPDFPKEDVKKTFMFFELLLGSVFKDNPYLEKGIATGTLRIAQQTLYSKWNNVVEHNFIYKPSSILQYYGLAQSDVDDLFQEHNVSPHSAEQAENWYDGYNMYQNPHKIKYYHPASTVKFLRSKQIESYWEEIEATEFLKRVLQKSPLIREKAIALLNHKEVVINMDHLRFSEELILDLKELFHTDDQNKIAPHICDLFFAFLFKKGYLTASETQYDGLTVIDAQLPNDQMHFEMTQALLLYYIDLYQMNDVILGHAASKFKEIFRDDGKYLSDLRDAIGSLLHYMPPLKELYKNVSYEAVLHNKNDLVCTIMHAVAMKMQCMYEFNFEVYYRSTLGGDLFIFEKKTKRSVVLVIKYNWECSKICMREAIQYRDALEGIGTIDQTTFIGINFQKNRTVHISISIDNPNENLSNDVVTLQPPTIGHATHLSLV